MIDRGKKEESFYMIFDQKAINTGRQTELDLARGFALLLVIVCHVGLFIGSPSNRFLYTLADIVGSEPAAPVFMVIMGAGVIYSGHKTPKEFFLRGVKLLMQGYLLSAFRTLLPRLIFGNVDQWTSVASFFAADILQFAGLTFLMLALLRKLKMPAWGVFALSLGMVLLGQAAIANPPDIPSEWAAYFLNLLIPVTEWSCFPFFTWFFFPAFGLVFGKALMHCHEKKRLYGILLPVSLAGVVYVYGQFYRFYPAYAEHYYYGGNYYYMGIKNVLLAALFVTFSLSIWYFAEGILPNFIKRFLTFLSYNIEIFYVFSWIFISVVMHLSAKLSVTFGSLMMVAIMIVITALCCVATYFYLWAKKKIRGQ